MHQARATGEVTPGYAYDGTMLVREMQTVSGSLIPTATYLIGSTGPIVRINESSQTEGYYLPSGGSLHSRGITRWYVHDGLGSVIGELDDNNDMATCRQYDVYGAPRASRLQGGAASSSQGYVGSLGHVTDASTGGLIYMQARYYDPVCGKFTSEDTGRNGDNWYIYCNDNPVCDLDANGKLPFSIGISNPNLVEKIYNLLEEDPEPTLGDIFDVFGGDIYRRRLRGRRRGCSCDTKVRNQSDYGRYSRYIL